MYADSGDKPALLAEAHDLEPTKVMEGRTLGAGLDLLAPGRGGELGHEVRLGEVAGERTGAEAAGDADLVRGELHVLVRGRVSGHAIEVVFNKGLWVPVLAFDLYTRAVYRIHRAGRGD